MKSVRISRCLYYAVVESIILFVLLYPADAKNTESISYEELERFSATQQKLDPNADPLLPKVIAKFGHRPEYLISEIKSVTGSPSTTAAKPAEGYKPPTALKPRPRGGFEPITYALAHPRLRQDSTDVLPAEDPSQQDLKPGEFSDLNGASFSYAYDGNAHTDTWSAQAALIVPMIWARNLEYGWKPIYYGFVPSISLYKVDTNGDPKNEVDSLIYRAGLFGQWLVAGGAGSDFHARLNLTGDFTYATDTHYDLSLPAGEFNLEPQIFSSPSLVLGYLGEIVYDDQRPYDDPKRVVVGYQLRTWLHGEYGTIQHSSEQVPPPANDFARIGPVVQLQLLFPTFLEGLILRVEYHFLPTLSGREGHDSLLKAGADLAIFKDKSGARISLKAAYTKGGLDLTKQDVETFTLGLGVLY